MAKQQKIKEEEINQEVKKTIQRDRYEPSEMVIREIMVNKNVDREEAIKILKNPTI